MTRLALPLLEAAPQAAVVFISSAVALAAVPHLSVYAATKAGVHSFARSLRTELADTHVSVFEALPPVVDTDLTRDLDVAKIAPSAVADAIVAGITTGKEQINIGQVRPLVVMAHVAPPYRRRHRPARAAHVMTAIADSTSPIFRWSPSGAPETL